MESLCRRTLVVATSSSSGLPSKPGFSDTALVDELEETEFGYKLQMARTRRLGRVVSGRVQPIAVTYADIKVCG